MDLQAVVPCEGLLASAAYVPSLLLFFSNCFADIKEYMFLDAATIIKELIYKFY